MYLTTARVQAHALKAATGEALWISRRRMIRAGARG